MRVVESTCHKIFLDSHAQSRFARRCHRVLRLHRGHVEEVTPESLRRESWCRTEGVTDFGHFPAQSGPMVRTGSTACKLLYLLLQRNGSRVRSIMNWSSLRNLGSLVS